MSLRYAADLPAAARAVAFDHTHPLWAEGRSVDDHRSYQAEQLARATPALLAYAGLLDEDGRLVASHKRFSLAMRVGGRRVPALGLGAVMVPEHARRRGLGRELVTRALDAARARGAKLAWLFSEIDPAYYEQFGFVRVDWPVFAAEVDALPRMTSLRAVAPELSEPPLDLADALDAARGAEALAPARDPHLRAYFAWRNDVERVWLERAGEIVAYVEVSRRPAPVDPRAPFALEVAEWAAFDVERDDLLGAMAAIARSRGAGFVAGPLGVDLADDRFARFTSDAHGTPMLASLDASIPLPIDGEGRLGADRVRFALTDYF